MWESEMSPEKIARYEAYSKLHAMAAAYGEDFAIPEIVAVGGQSDGKSTLLEAFLGFRFNVREVEMGSRRPLMLQMVHCPEATEPQCCFQDEDEDSYGEPLSNASSIAAEIRCRTEVLLKSTGRSVHPKPIVMKCRYAYCPNLTIIDTPGFVLKSRDSEPGNTAEDIMKMVQEYMEPKHRLILFLQQSSVEWCSSLWLPVIQEVDPGFERTVIVVSKFDNRLKEFSAREEIDQYLSASGYLQENLSPFFVALPNDKSATSPADFRKRIAEIDQQVWKTLTEKVQGGFDQERFGEFVGFRNLRRSLEALLEKKYKDAAPTTLQVIEERCQNLKTAVNKAQVTLDSFSDVREIRKSHFLHAHVMKKALTRQIGGQVYLDPAHYGQTTFEERTRSGVEWPACHDSDDWLAEHSSLKLYGPAAVSRLVGEFQEAVTRVSFEEVSTDMVANSILHLISASNASQSSLGRQSLDEVALQLSFSTGKKLLEPVLKAGLRRLRHILMDTYVTCSQTMLSDQDTEYLGGEAQQPLDEILRRQWSSHIEEVCYEREKAFPTQFEKLIKSMSSSMVNIGPLYDDFQGGKDISDTGPQFSFYTTHARGLLKEIRESQVVIPETPSPGLRDTTNIQDNGIPSRKRRATNRTEGHCQKRSFDSLCQDVKDTASSIFARMKQIVGQEIFPQFVQYLFNEECVEDFMKKLMMDTFSLPDVEFMSTMGCSRQLEKVKSLHSDMSAKLKALDKAKAAFQSVGLSI